MNLVLIATIANITLFSLLGVFLLSTNKGAVLANRILGLFFLLWVFDFADGILMLSGFYLDYPSLALLTEPLIFLYGPLIYGYTMHTLNIKRGMRIKDLWHLIPVLASTLLIIFSYHLQPRTLQISILEQVVSLKQPWQIYLVYLCIYIHFFSYLFISKKLLKTREEEMKQFYANNHLKWLNQLLNGLIAIMVISVFNSLLQFIGSRLFFELSVLVIQLTTGIFIGRLILKVLHQPTFLLGMELQQKYAGSTLSKTEAEQLGQQILIVLEKDRLFLNPELTLDQFSKVLAITSRQLSQVINEQLGKNFFELINSYRIEEAKKIFKEQTNSKLTVLEVMYAVGFNSKSSFNTQFKLRTGLTPSEFLKKNSG